MRPAPLSSLPEVPFGKILATAVSNYKFSSTMNNTARTKLLHMLTNIQAALPGVAKWAIFLLFLANFRSWPLGWHFRVFLPVFRIRLKHKLLQLRTLLYSKKAKIEAEDKWLDSITPIGANPFEHVIKYNSWASIDESDFNGHMSNSSYPKVLDAARFKTALDMFPRFFTSGGWIPLAGTHFNFVREIPMLSSYEVRVTTGSWDNKWVYVISKFVTKPKGKKRSKDSKTLIASTTNGSSKHGGDSSANISGDELFHPSLRQPSSASAFASPTPLQASPAHHPSTEAGAEAGERLKAVTDSLLASTSRTGGIEPDGALLHTVSVSQCCFKVGRITVPPALVFALNGFSAPPTTATSEPDGVARPYSATNPPPHWEEVRKLMAVPCGGSPRKMREFMKGGWRDVPEGERWWEEAFRGVEEKTVRRMEVVGRIGGTMGELRTF